MLSGFDPNQITNLDGDRQGITLLLNLVEELKQENEQLLPKGNICGIKSTG